MLTNDQLIALKAEIDDDPEELGYASDDPDTAALLNEIRSGAAYEMPNTSVSVNVVMDAIDFDELSALDANTLNGFWLRMQIAGGSVDISAGKAVIIQAAATFTLADAPNSRAALNALNDREGSRAEILFGSGVTITHLDVGTARLI